MLKSPAAHHGTTGRPNLRAIVFRAEHTARKTNAQSIPHSGAFVHPSNFLGVDERSGMWDNFS